MSRWARLHFTAFRNLKHSLYLFFVHFELGRLLSLFIIAVTLTIFVADGNAVADRLFQSPASPPTQPPPATQPPTQPPATQPPTQPPPATQPPAQPPPATQPPAQPPSTEQQAQPTAESSESAPVFESPVSEPLPEGSGPPPFAQPTVETGADRFTAESSSSNENEDASSSNFILDRVELVDSVVVSGAYVWLCCGVVLLLLIPLFFLFLQIRGQIKIQREEDY